MRELTRGAPGLWLAALFLAVRLLAGSMAIAAPGPGTLAGETAICHTGVPDDAPAPGSPAHDTSCLLCPACHVASQASLPAPMPHALPALTGGEIGRAALPPPSTAPPRQPRGAAHPTGPPTASL